MRLTGAAAVCQYAARHCPDIPPDEVFAMLPALGDASVSELIQALARTQHERRHQTTT